MTGTFHCGKSTTVVKRNENLKPSCSRNFKIKKKKKESINTVLINSNLIFTFFLIASKFRALCEHHTHSSFHFLPSGSTNDSKIPIPFYLKKIMF